MTTPTPETKYRQALERIRDLSFHSLDLTTDKAMRQIAREALEEEGTWAKTEAICTCPSCNLQFVINKNPGITLLPCPSCGAKLKVEF